MSDLNNSTPADLQNVGAEPAAVAEKTVSTAKHARHLLAQAVARLAKQEVAVAETKASIANYEHLANTLPEEAERTGKVGAVYELGDEVRFRYGRTTTTSVARELSGTVVARKDKDTGKPEAYKVQVGTGFDAELLTVAPGAIFGKVGEPDAEVEPESAPVTDAAAAQAEPEQATNTGEWF